MRKGRGGHTLRRGHLTSKGFSILHAAHTLSLNQAHAGSFFFLNSFYCIMNIVRVPQKPHMSKIAL